MKIFFAANSSEIPVPSKKSYPLENLVIPLLLYNVISNFQNSRNPLLFTPKKMHSQVELIPDSVFFKIFPKIRKKSLK